MRSDSDWCFVFFRRCQTKLSFILLIEILTFSDPLDSFFCSAASFSALLQLLAARFIIENTQLKNVLHLATLRDHFNHIFNHLSNVLGFFFKCLKYTSDASQPPKHGLFSATQGAWEWLWEVRGRGLSRTGNTQYGEHHYPVLVNYKTVYHGYQEYQTCWCGINNTLMTYFLFVRCLCKKRKNAWTSCVQAYHKFVWQWAETGHKCFSWLGIGHLEFWDNFCVFVLGARKQSAQFNNRSGCLNQAGRPSSLFIFLVSRCIFVLISWPSGPPWHPAGPPPSSIRLSSHPLFFNTGKSFGPFQVTAVS